MFLEVKSKLFLLKWSIDMRFYPMEQQNNTPKTLLFFQFHRGNFSQTPYIKNVFSMDLDESQE